MRVRRNVLNRSLESGRYLFAWAFELDSSRGQICLATIMDAICAEFAADALLHWLVPLLIAVEASHAKLRHLGVPLLQFLLRPDAIATNAWRLFLVVSELDTC